VSLDPQVVVLPTVSAAPDEKTGVIVRAVLATKDPLAETLGASAAFGSTSREIETVCDLVVVVKPVPLAVALNVMTTAVVLPTVPARVTVQVPPLRLVVAYEGFADVHVYATVAVLALPSAVLANTGVASTNVRVAAPALLNIVALPVSVAVEPVMSVVIEASASRVNGTST
jgi:hypothetical protein